MSVPVLDDVHGFDGLAVARYGHATVRRRHTGRIVVNGDAAHPSPPHLGQGASLALLDAAALADGLQADPDVPDALRRWDKARRMQNPRHTTMSRAFSPFSQSSHAWLAPLRDIALPVMGQVPPARWLMERVLAGHG